MTPENEFRLLLPRLDAAIEREIARLRGRYQLSLDEFRGLYVSDDRVDALVQSVGIEIAGGMPLPAGVAPPIWDTVVGTFELDQLDADLLLVGLAPELDVRYPTLFAYLNDEVSARRPTIDLAMRLLGDGSEKRAAVRERLQPYGRLARSGLLLLDWSSPLPIAQTPFSIAPIVARHLLGGNVLAACGLEEIANDVEILGADGSSAMAEWLGKATAAPIIILAGRDGTGRRDFATQLARTLGRRLARFQASSVDQSPASVGDAILSCKLTRSLLFVEAEGMEPDVIGKSLLSAPRPLFLSVHKPGPWERVFAAVPNIAREFAVPDFDRRRSEWQKALRSHGLRVAPSAINAVAARFRLPQGSIRRAVRDVQLARVHEGAVNGPLPPSLLMHHARRQCAPQLDQVATRIEARPDWSDLVLPAEVLAHLRDFASACAERDRVFASWGMGSIGHTRSRGVAALFAGASGTGKTLSAAVIARATSLDLWKINISSVISKYIGETEKNLDRIFATAQDGDVILFFDEADAIFGKRSDVKDAHDRYSNIEISYLLQRIEEYGGISILASNFIRNIDQAFTRRLNYIIEFPLPDQRLREKLWRKAFAPSTPIRGVIDHGFLGQQFALTGGDIRAASLDAAFLAASDGGAVTMDHVIRAVSRQMLKQGHVPSSFDPRVGVSRATRSRHVNGAEL